MPEYLAPGVYVEEVSFRSKSIEGVSTSVAGFIGATRFGPAGGDAELMTSFAEYSRIFGGIDRLEFDGVEPADNYMAHAVRAFFDNGGTKLYIARVFNPLESGDDGDPDEDPRGKSVFVSSPPGVTLRARSPGRAGDMRIAFTLFAGPNVLVRPDPSAPPTLRGIRDHYLVMLRARDNQSGLGSSPALFDVVRNQDESFALADAGSVRQISTLDPTHVAAHIVTINVAVQLPSRFADEQVWTEMQPHPQARGSLTGYFSESPESRRQYLETPFVVATQGTVDTGRELVALLLGDQVLRNLALFVQTPIELASQSPPVERPALESMQRTYFLSGGNDGRIPVAENYRGREIGLIKTGLLTFEDVDEISMVAAPGSSAKYGDEGNDSLVRAAQIAQALDTHCLRMRYRVSILDSRDKEALSEVRDYRGRFDSTHAAFYYPWVTTVDPLDPDGRREIDLPPSGYVAGIYARTDVLHGVFKAPANEVALGAIGFETLLNKAQQDVLNPIGINCFRFFVGRGYRLWGARTISSDPEWKYVSVRRYFAYLEHSIDRGTQWAVFENNGPRLWANITLTVTDFLINEWRNGALLGDRPEDAFFVRCDRSTMTQNDLDNGRLVCLIGVAVVKPAEFVIFRIGQMTADARR